MSCDEVVSVKGKGRRRCRGQFTKNIAVNSRSGPESEISEVGK